MKNKRAAVIAAILFATVQIFCCACGNTNAEEKILRVQVRADSDSAEAQAVKEEVAAAVNYYLSVELRGIFDFDTAYQALRERVGAAEAIAKAVLRRYGYGYGASATLGKEYFSAREYGDGVLASGDVDALVLTLGTGGGDSRWSIVYPQTSCAQSGQDGAVYKSLIAEVIDKYFR